jgi:hypothetical protein
LFKTIFWFLCAFDVLPSNLRYLLGYHNMFLLVRVKIINFVEMGISVILCFQWPINHPKHLLGPHDMFLHVCVKTITFIKICIFEILCFWCPTGQPNAHFRASRYLFACRYENHNFSWKGHLGNISLSMPDWPTKGTI